MTLTEASTISCRQEDAPFAGLLGQARAVSSGASTSPSPCSTSTRPDLTAPSAPPIAGNGSYRPSSTHPRSMESCLHGRCPATTIPRPTATSTRGRVRGVPRSGPTRADWCSLVAGAITVVVLAGCGASATAPSATGTSRAAGAVGTTTGSTTADRPDFAGQVDLGNGRSIYLECRGTGSPTVVLVTGLGERADNWMTTSDTPPQPDRSVFPGVATFTRVCAYDRPGTATAKSDQSGYEVSRSTPVAQPATVKDSAVDLDALLNASGEPGPYVLVGHSLGGPIVRLYAGDHPTKVAGLVLDDALSEDVGDGLTSTQRESFEKLNDPVSQGRPAGSEQDLYASALVPQLRAAPPAPSVPVIVLTADRWPFTPEVIAAGHESGQLPSYVTQEFTDALWTSQLEAQDKLAAKFPGAKHITNTNASHYIHLDNPRLVIDSIREVVDHVRSNRPG